MRMIRTSLICHPRSRTLRVLLAVAAGWLGLCSPARAQIRVPTRGGVVELEAKQQRREGRIFYAEGDVEIRYQNLRLRADHVEFNSETGEAAARGNIRFELDSQLIEGTEAHYNLKTGRGSFRDVQGTIRVQRRPITTGLASKKPL